MQRYNKAIVAVVMAAIVVWNTFFPDRIIDADEGAINQWVILISSVAGPLLVYAVPNRDA